MAFLHVLPLHPQPPRTSAELYSSTRHLRGLQSPSRLPPVKHSRIHICACANANDDINNVSKEDMGFDPTHTHSSGGSQPPTDTSSTAGSASPVFRGIQTNGASYRPPIDYELQPGEVGVRFINGPSGSDVIAAAKPGDNLLAVGDSVNVRIPRACQSGLCGSCTCDILDTTKPEGRQTVRACQTGVDIPDSGPEMIIDVSRMKSFRKERDPMARFENLDTGYVAGAAPRAFGGSGRPTIRECSECSGTGEVACDDCDGTGADTINGTDTCIYCFGARSIRCGFCQGTGEIHTRR